MSRLTLTDVNLLNIKIDSMTYLKFSLVLTLLSYFLDNIVYFWTYIFWRLIMSKIKLSPPFGVH